MARLLVVVAGIAMAHGSTAPSPPPLPPSKSTWKYDSGMSIGGSAALVGSEVIFGNLGDGGCGGDGNGCIRALSKADGALHWQTHVGAQVYDIVASGSNLFLGADSIWALRQSDGSPVWNYTGEVDPKYGQRPGHRNPAVGNGVVVAGCEYCMDSLLAVNESSGSLLWKARFTNSGNNYTAAVNTQPTIVGDVVFATTRDTMYSLNLATGGLRWSAPAQSVFQRVPVVSEGRVFTPMVLRGPVWDGFLAAYDATTGSELWRTSTGYWNDYNGAGAVANGIVYFPHSFSVLGFNVANGELLWQWDNPNNGITGSVVITNGVLYVNTNYGRDNFDSRGLLAIDIASKQVKWMFWAGNDDTNVDMSRPQISDGMVYWGSNSGTFFAWPTSGPLCLKSIIV